MNSVDFAFQDEQLTACRSGALFWAAKQLLVVSDLHLGKSERIARRGGALLPPYDTVETLARLSSDVEALAPKTVICLGDSFDDLDASLSLSDEARDTVARLPPVLRDLFAPKAIAYLTGRQVLAVPVPKSA